MIVFPCDSASSEVLACCLFNVLGVCRWIEPRLWCVSVRCRANPMTIPSFITSLSFSTSFSLSLVHSFNRETNSIIMSQLASSCPTTLWPCKACPAVWPEITPAWRQTPRAAVRAITSHFACAVSILPTPGLPFHRVNDHDLIFLIPSSVFFFVPLRYFVSSMNFLPTCT